MSFKEPRSERVVAFPARRKLARVLLVDSDLASRLAVQTLLATVGYAVDGAASSSEAMALLDGNQYQLVLADLRTEGSEAGTRLLAYARQKEFHPATASLSSRLVRMSDENVSFLLARVAELIGERADRRMRRAVARAC